MFYVLILEIAAIELKYLNVNGFSLCKGHFLQFPGELTKIIFYVWLISDLLQGCKDKSVAWWDNCVSIYLVFLRSSSFTSLKNSNDIIKKHLAN